MHGQTQYQHPVLEPWSRAGWSEVAYSWIIGMVVVAAVLVVLA